MMSLSCRHGLLSAAALAMTACAVSTDEPEQQITATQTFSAEDKRIARALSIGGQDVQAAATPQFGAALCSLALAEIRDRLQDSGVLSAEQQQAFAQAQALFQRRSAAGLSPAEREQVRKDVEAAHPEPADRARFAIGCLRQLA